MRIEKDVPPITIDGRNVAFRDWVLALGDGTEPSFLLGDDPDPSWIKIPDEVRVEHNGDALDAIVNEIYGELHLIHGDIDYLRNRAILIPLNEFVESVNNQVLKRLPGDFRMYKSCDNICKASSSSAADEALVTSPAGLKIACIDEDAASAGYTKNIVYREIFDNII
ncbi:hypothetical protein POM88_029235 [Heracleum sosnowskyi]|uniref:ATP-dependent DNA helicase n=1 Tax=Heracleum sosnowskyi TaxID=360622 RepID=A0AAD8HT92_9APIA|nr:hypothetical protein POM88_029235 [Heracleum sosnowskyi]